MMFPLSVFGTSPSGLVDDGVAAAADDEGVLLLFWFEVACWTPPVDGDPPMD